MKKSYHSPEDKERLKKHFHGLGEIWDWIDDRTREYITNRFSEMIIINDLKINKYDYSKGLFRWVIIAINIGIESIKYGYGIDTSLLEEKLAKDVFFIPKKEYKLAWEYTEDLVETHMKVLGNFLEQVNNRDDNEKQKAFNSWIRKNIKKMATSVSGYGIRRGRHIAAVGS